MLDTRYYQKKLSIAKWGRWSYNGNGRKAFKEWSFSVTQHILNWLIPMERLELLTLCKYICSSISNICFIFISDHKVNKMHVHDWSIQLWIIFINTKAIFFLALNLNCYCSVSKSSESERRYSVYWKELTPQNHCQIICKFSLYNPTIFYYQF